MNCTPHETIILIYTLMGIGLGIIAIGLLIQDYFIPRFSPMGPWPSKFEEDQQKSVMLKQPIKKSTSELYLLKLIDG